MLHPVGSRNPAVYWRRRFVLLGAVIVLVIITALVMRPSSGGTEPAAAHHPTSSAESPADHVVTSPTAPKSSTRTSHSATAKTSPTGSGTPTSAALACTTTQLQVAAVVGKSSYHVGDQPVVMLQVKNKGPAACVQNLADSQVELRVYNGESRVWGSHDCEVQPGTSPRTLAVGQAVRESVTWSGLSSQPGCKGTRQRVGAGTYTLYALLAGHLGTAAQFSIS